MIIENSTKKNSYIEIMKIKEEERKMDKNSEGSFWKIKWTRTQNTTPTISQWRKSKNEWLMTTKLMTQSKRKIVTISKKKQHRQQQQQIEWRKMRESDGMKKRREEEVEREDWEYCMEQHTKSIRNVFQIEAKRLFRTTVQINQSTNGNGKRIKRYN